MTCRRVFAIFVFACFLISVWSLADARGLRRWRHLHHSCCDDNCGRPATDDVAELVIQGDALREKDDWKGAIAAYTKAIERDPQCAKAYCGRGRALGNMDRTDASIADLNMAIRLDPTDASAYNARGVGFSDKHEYRKALTDLDEAIRLDARLVRAYINRAVARWKLGDHRGALADLNEAIHLDEKDAEVWAVRGSYHSKMGDTERALDDATHAIQIEPKFARGFALRGYVLLARDEPAKAIADLRESIRLDPSDSCVHFALSESYRRCGNFRKAIAEASEAIRLDPTDADCYLSRALGLTRLDRDAEAVADMDEAIKLNPKSPCFYELRGAFWLYCKNYDRAMADFRTMMRLNRADPVAKFSEPADPPLSAAALKHGREQVRQMLHDRPVMAKYGDKAAVLREWAARKFAGEDLHDLVLWNSTNPSVHFVADSTPPANGKLARIRAWREYAKGPDKGKERPFEIMWCNVVFELYNVASATDFAKVQNEATAGNLSRREFCTKIMEVEGKACEKIRAFYIRVFLPWAKQHGVQTNPASWCVAKRLDVKTNIFLAGIDDNDPHWEDYGQWYDRIVVAAITTASSDNAANELADRMLKNAANNDEKSVICYAIGCRREQQDSFALAVAQFDEAIRLNPKNALAHYSRGWMYANGCDRRPTAASPAENLNRAIADTSTAIRLDPSLAVAYGVRGGARLAQNDLDGVIADYSEYIRLDPSVISAYRATLIDAHLRRAEAREAKSDWTGAIADLIAAQKLAPACELPSYLAQSNASDAATKDSQSSTTNNTPSKPLQGDLLHGTELARASDSEQNSATTASKKSSNTTPTSQSTVTKASITPKLAAAYVGRSADRDAKGDLRGAIADLNEAIPLAPCDSALREARGILYQRVGEPKKAIADLNPVLDQSRFRPQAMLYRGMAILDTGHTDAAIADFTEALRLRCHEPATAYRGLATALMKKGDLAAALRQADAAIQADPRCVEAYTFRARIHEKMGHGDKAKADLAEARRLGSLKR